MDDKISTAAEAHEADALPKRREVHADRQAVREVALPKGVTAETLKTKSPAEWAYERLILYIQTFEEQLDEEHEVAMGFAGGEAGVLRIEGMGFFDPDILTFFGVDDMGMKTQLIQHVTQLSVILSAFPKNAQEEAPRRIGFRLADVLEGEEVSAAVRAKTKAKAGGKTKT